MKRFLFVTLFSFLLAAQNYAVSQEKQPGEVKGGEFTLERFEFGTLMDEKIAEKQKEISKIRQEKIKKMLELLNNPYYENRAEVYFRLAEAYWQEIFFNSLLARAEYEKKMEEYEAGRLSEKPEEPIEDYTISLNYYRKVLQEFPNYARIDEVMYYLGRGALKEGKARKDRLLQKEGTEYLLRLIQNYPKSKFIPDAHLALGEYYFENNFLYYAKNNYEKIINNYRDSPMFNYALYKLAWVYFNQREFDKTIDTFKRVIEEVEKSGEKLKIEFRSQAISDLIITYAEVDNGWVLAKDYFLKILGEEDAYKKLRALGDLYVAQDKDLEAIALFRHFIEKEKTTKKIPEYYRIILGIYKKTNDIPNMEAVTLEILEYFKEKGTWVTVNRENPEALKEAHDMGEEYLLFIANHYHKEAEKFKRQDLYMKTANYYAMFLDRFPESAKGYIVNFYYAEILFFQMNDYAKAAEQYKKVVERDTKGEYVEEAALGLIHSYEELMVKAGIQERAKKGEIDIVKIDPKLEDAPIPETPLHELEEEYVKGADLYVKLLSELIKDPAVKKKNPKRGEKIPEIMYISAQVFYRHGKFKEAVERLKILFEYDPQHKFAAYAVFTLLDCYKRLQRWTKVEEWARKLIAAKNFKVKSKKELEKIVAISISENAKQLSAEKAYEQATKESLRIYDEFKGEEEMASTALYNAAALLEGQKKVDEAIAMYKRVVKEFPKSKMAPEALWTIGVIYESQTLFDKAADTFEEMAKFEKAKQTPDALKNAGLIREALGQYKDAIEVYRKFIKMYPEHEDAHLVDFRIGLTYETMGDSASLKKAHDHFVEFVKKYKGKPELVVEAYARAGDCLKRVDKVKNRKSAELLFKNAIDSFNKLSPNAKAVEYSKRYAAQSAFELAEYAYDDFIVLKIPSTLDPNVLKKALSMKAEAQVKTEKLYEAVLTYKSAGWTAGALFRKGLLYYDFYRQLMEVPVPDCPCPGIPAKDCKAVQNAFKANDLDTVNSYPWGSDWLAQCSTFEEEYRLVIEEIARPVEEKSLKAFEHALRLAHEEKVYNKWSKLSGEYATKVNPDLFPVSNEEYVSQDRLADTLLSASFIQSLRRGNIEVKYLQQEEKK